MNLGPSGCSIPINGGLRTCTAFGGAIKIITLTTRTRCYCLDPVRCQKGISCEFSRIRRHVSQRPCLPETFTDVQRVVKGMTTQESDLIQKVIEALNKLVPYNKPDAIDSTPCRCPVAVFAKRYLLRDLGSAMTSVELWDFFREVAALGDVETLSKSEFLRRLPGAMGNVYGIKKCHNIRSKTGRVRGFRGISVREIELPPDCV
jgi:hypothetical protein